MGRLLITHSLLSSWQWALKENPFEDATSERDNYADFLQVLRRELKVATKAMQDGIDFEDMVTDILAGGGDKTHRWYDGASKIADIIRGGVLQLKVNKNITVAGMDFVLHGRLDALKAGTIYDIKFASGYDVGKYIDSTQHPAYLELVPEAMQFTYLVSNGSQVWPETYRRDETPSIYPLIEDFMSWLSAQGLMELYREKWGSL